MRMMLKVCPDIDAANKKLATGRLGVLMQTITEMIEPEAAYHFTENGCRASLFVFDLDDQSRLPQIAEPLFNELKAKVEFTPVMTTEDLLIGLRAIEEVHELADTVGV